MDGWGVALLLPLLLPVAVGSTVADAVRLALALGEDVDTGDIVEVPLEVAGRVAGISQQAAMGLWYCCQGWSIASLSRTNDVTSSMYGSEPKPITSLGSPVFHHD
jgi:hypothetical protein